jgi:hypothetical protein
MRVVTESSGNYAIVEMLRNRDFPDDISTYISLATLVKNLRPAAVFR